MLEEIKEYVIAQKDPMACIEEIKNALHEVSENAQHPIDCVKWVPLEMVQPNDYNPNSVAGKEMSLLHVSISNDGYTQPIVTIWDEEKQKYIIIDGFHRYYTCRLHEDIQKSTNKMLPIVVLKKDINERMAATVRHNRARGEHSISGMSNLVYNMLKNGMKDSEVCNNLGLEPDELIKLKHLTGFSKLFAHREYNQSWETPGMIKLRKAYEQKN